MKKNNTKTTGQYNIAGTLWKLLKKQLPKEPKKKGRGRPRVNNRDINGQQPACERGNIIGGELAWTEEAPRVHPVMVEDLYAVLIAQFLRILDAQHGFVCLG